VFEHIFLHVQQNCANGGEEDPKPFLKNFRNLKLGL
jgi:hypothetical protein